ncbi:MAG: AraC family transcriptional regulator [Gammaproteobacteria bacterium]|nr:AraC family transcriptional regulator [Gammaproteobacteria bacterium]
MVRLNLILPFVQMLDRLRLDTDAVLTANGLVRETVIDPNVFVPIIVIHRFLEDAARAANDPYLGVHVGESLELSSWSPFVDAVSLATTLGEFLIRFIRAAKDEASSARHSLEIGANHTAFKEIRTSEQEIAPAQNDAFTAAYTLGLLRRGAGSSWNAKNVRLKVCNPEVFPSGYLGVTIIGGDRMGMVLHFPTGWLLQPLDQRTLLQVSSIDQNRLHPPVEFVDALRQTLMPHLDNASQNVDYVAQLSGMSRQSLQRKLKVSGTTLSAEVVELKKHRAAEDLIHSDKPIAKIATSLGFTNPTSFARAFKSWTGQSPREYRKGQRGH